MLVHMNVVDHEQHTPLRLAVCNLYECEALTTYAGGGCWDVDTRGGPKYRAYPVEFAYLREKMVQLRIPQAPNMLRFGRVHHQSMLHRGRQWKRAPQY